MNQHIQKIVLTGGPGVGKTSIIQCLQKLGYDVREEVFTRLFAEAQKIGAFNDEFLRSKKLILDLILAQKHLESQTGQGNLLFLDRSRIDILGYIKNMGILPSKEDKAWLEQNDYALIFMIQPLPEKHYDQNSVRRQTQQESLEHHRSINQHYIDFLNVNGLDSASYLINVPYFEGKTEESVLKRTQFILKKVKGSQ
jgi:predicted ATPase